MAVIYKGAWPRQGFVGAWQTAGRCGLLSVAEDKMASQDLDKMVSRDLTAGKASN